MSKKISYYTKDGLDRLTSELSEQKTKGRSSIAKQIGFNDVSNGEDKFFSEGIKPLLKTQVKIDKLLYFYQYSSQNKLYK